MWSEIGGIRYHPGWGNSPSTALGQAGKKPHGEEGWTCGSGGLGMSWVLLGLVFNLPFGRMQEKLLLFLECICSPLLKAMCSCC